MLYDDGSSSDVEKWREPGLIFKVEATGSAVSLDLWCDLPYLTQLYSSVKWG